jgi:hypothetical protein
VRPIPWPPPPPVLDRLTPEQDRLLSLVGEEWRRAGLSTAPADRPSAEAGARLAYQAAGLAPPLVVIWLDSPLAGYLAVAGPIRERVTGSPALLVTDQLGAAVLEQVSALAGGDCYRVWAQVWDRLGRGVWDRLDEQVARPVLRRVAEQVTRPVREQVAPVARGVWEQLQADVRAQAGDKIGYWLHGFVRGQHDLGPLSAYDSLKRAAPELTGPERLRGHMQVARSAGWWWPFRGAVILTERPRTLHHDEQGRLHHPHGPALRYPDGFGVWAWHGVRVPRDVVEQPQALTVRRIQQERNVEVRRVMLERYGQGRYLRDAGARRVQADRTGVLWRCELGDDEPLVMVEVRDATPEPDGSRRTYWLRVPPDLRSAREAVAWTFGLRRREYKPRVQT